MNNLVQISEYLVVCPAKGAQQGIHELLHQSAEALVARFAAVIYTITGFEPLRNAIDTSTHGRGHTSWHWQGIQLQKNVPHGGREAMQVPRGVIE